MPLHTVLRNYRFIKKKKHKWNLPCEEASVVTVAFLHRNKQVAGNMVPVLSCTVCSLQVPHLEEYSTQYCLSFSPLKKDIDWLTIETSKTSNFKIVCKYIFHKNMKLTNKKINFFFFLHKIQNIPKVVDVLLVVTPAWERERGVAVVTLPVDVVWLLLDVLELFSYALLSLPILLLEL